MDPHRNIFFYYAGSSKAVEGRDRQLENNTTKALINLLEISAGLDSQSPLVNRFLNHIDVNCSSTPGPRFALQLATIGEAALARTKQRVLLGIAPRVDEISSKPDHTSPDAGSLPDAWIWSKNFAVCIETKVTGTFDPTQLARHEKILGDGARTVRLCWKEIYAFFAAELAGARNRDDDTATTVLLDQFLAYLRIIAYRQEIDMGEFDGFRPEHFDAFTFLDDEYAEDTRKQVKHYLGQFLEEVRAALPPSLHPFKHKRVGNVGGRAQHTWATLSRNKKSVDEPHFSFAIHGDRMSLKLLLEGKKAVMPAKREIETNPTDFLKLLRALPAWTLAVNRRRITGVRKFDTALACSIDLQWAGESDVEYVIQKMCDLRRMDDGKGLFELRISRNYSVDSLELRTKEFARTAAKAIEELLPIEEFFTSR